MLKIKKSRLPNAGKGLFTTSAIRKGDIIVEYKGDNLTWDQCLKRYGENIHTACYLYYISPKNCIDAQFRLEELARYANDANGFSVIKGLKNNAEFVNIKGVPYLKAIANIPANAEIYCDYSGDYWEIMKAQAEADKKEAEEKKTKGEKAKQTVKNEKKGKKGKIGKSEKSSKNDKLVTKKSKGKK